MSLILLIYLTYSEINRYSHAYQIILRIVKYQSYGMIIINLLGAPYLIPISLFVIIKSNLVLLTPETAKTVHIFPAVGNVIRSNLKSFLIHGFPKNNK